MCNAIFETGIAVAFTGRLQIALMVPTIIEGVAQLSLPRPDSTHAFEDGHADDETSCEVATILSLVGSPEPHHR